MATRIPGNELMIPDRSFRPIMLSDESGQEIPIDIQQHAIDVLFDFYVSDETAPPATGKWTILKPRGDGVITHVGAMIVDNGASGSAHAIQIEKNGANQLTSALELDHSDTENVEKAGVITGGQINFAAGDRITIGWTKGANDGTGVKIHLRGYYKRDQ